MKQNKIKHTLNNFYSHYIKKNFKFIPILGIIILFIMVAGQKPGEITSKNIDATFIEKTTQTLNALSQSFNFVDKTYLVFTIVLLITIWTGYKYWLKRLKYVRRNSKLLERLVIVSIFIIFCVRHITISSMIGKYIDWILFLLFLYLIVAGTWFLAKTIDGIDLSSDLYCWGLRILGVLIIFFGFMLFISSNHVLTFSNSKLVFNNIYWILSICIMLLGAFMDYRSFRRHPAIHVW